MLLFWMIVVFAPFVLLSFYAVGPRSVRSLEKKERLKDDRLPRVSILKPVKNADGPFAENIESFYRSDYPNFEVLFAVETENDPAVPVIREVAVRYPHIRTLILVTGTDKPLNPKVDNLAKMERHATGDLYWIADANVRVSPDTLSRLVEEYLLNGTKLVFCPITATGARTFGALVENAYLNYYITGNLIAAWRLFRIPIVIGKSLLIEREALEKHFGGFRPFEPYLAEDYMMGLLFRKKNLRVSTNFTPAENVNRDSSLRSFYDRMSRWAVMRFQIKPKLYLSEVLMHPIVWSLVSVPFLGKSGMLLLVTATVVKMVLEYINALSQPNERPSWRTLLVFPMVVVVKDILSFIIYLSPFVTRRVRWRGRTITVEKDSLIALVPDGGLEYEN